MEEKSKQNQNFMDFMAEGELKGKPLCSMDGRALRSHQRCQDSVRQGGGMFPVDERDWEASRIIRKRLQRGGSTFTPGDIKA